MSRGIVILFIFSFFSLNAICRHISGGELSYIYLGPGTTGTAKYRVTLKLYRECNSARELGLTAEITIFETGTNTRLLTREFERTKFETITLKRPDKCIENAPVICYDIGYYIFEINLPLSKDGYTIVHDVCCRLEGISNVVLSENSAATYTAIVPGNTILVPNAIENNSPIFNTSDTIIICANNQFTYNFGATDIDNDQLQYAFARAYNGRVTIGSRTPPPLPPPPYESLNYSFGYSADFPLGSKVKIDPKSGEISGIAPDAGTYVITVEVTEKRVGQVINIHRKDLHLKVADCTVAKAQLDSYYINCKDYTIQLANRVSSSLIKTYEWDFGIPGVATSTLEKPILTYPSPGEYPLRLITNKGIDCSDTAYSSVKVYPGFSLNRPTISETCESVPFTFTDNSTTVFGIVDKWKWDFGRLNVINDTANGRLVSYVYPSAGTYTVTLIASTDLGCVDTLYQSIDVKSKPVFTIPFDTIICNIDTLKIDVVGDIGTYEWSPNYMISDTKVNDPLVSPDVSTRYSVTLTQAPGCETTKSIFVVVKSFVSLDVGLDTTICLGDSILLRPISDGLQFRWSPSTTVSSPDKKITWIKPTETTRYSLFSTIGKCQANDGLVITTVPFPLAFAGVDTVVCYGDQVQLFATGGSQYLWDPGNTLNDQTLQNPIAQPWQTTDYVVGVYENVGCPKPVYDTVRVRVVPPVPAFAGNDTAVVIGEPLQLLATGGVTYRWSPSSFLNNSAVSDPIARLNDDITYVVRVATPEGCFANDTMLVKVYKTPPEIFVPTVFTPNNDGLNDKLTPIPVGIKQMVYFKVYNRYGELVFNTDQIGKGWNGVFRRKDQGNESFVWHALGIDYLGNEVFRKGQFTLIR